MEKIRKENKDYFYSLEKSKKIYDLNISTYFLLPLIIKNNNIRFNLYQLMVEYSLKECFKYLKDSENGFKDLYLVFEENELNEEFVKFANKLDIEILDEFYFENENGNFWVVRTPIIDEVPNRDIEKILMGKYSEVSEETLKLYPRTQTRDIKEDIGFSLVLEDIELEYEIIKKSHKALYTLNFKYDLDLDHEDLEGVEYWDTVDLNKEILDPKTFKQK